MNAFQYAPLQVVEMKLLERGGHEALFRASQPLPTQRVPPGGNVSHKMREVVNEFSITLRFTKFIRECGWTKIYFWTQEHFLVNQISLKQVLGAALH